MVAHTLVFSVKQAVSLRAFQMKGADLTLGSRFLIYSLDQLGILRLKKKKKKRRMVLIIPRRNYFTW